MNDEEFRGLLVLGLFAAFDRPATARDRDTLIAVLLRAKLARAQAEQTADAVLANPGRFGF
ncbi:MAG: hypothetical protein HY749_00065 [Gammaproteobacteria bacterium]|nr:hypothetical protein [Gammaproteobacteria bacterium]MBI5617516.1 hypothetical protein [Gammaproteobacteria bacterium]